jgi:transposase-like protein
MKHGNFNLMQVALMGEDECKKHLAFSRWGGTTVCPYCENDKCYTTKTGYKCAKCRRVFSVTVGTIFHDSRIKLTKWYIALYLITAHKKGISSHQLARDIDVTQKTAWYMLHRLRHTFKDNGYTEKLSKTVEVDETFVGGKNRNRHWNKKVPNSQGRSFKDKTPVFGMLQRGGKLRAQSVPDTKRKTLEPIILANVKKNAKVMSDEWTAYNKLYKNFTHKVVNHRRFQYVVGTAHTNTIEGFWSLFKRGILGIYHNVSRKHLDRYVDEFVYRYNTRNEKPEKRMKKVLQSKKQLSFKQLTK